MADRERARRIGGRVGIALHAAIVGVFTAVCGAQVLLQVWGVGAPPATTSCRPGVDALFSAVDRARAAASATRGEREALRVFRERLAPEWDARADLEVRCAGDPEGLADLGLVERLRYAEERAVRADASNLARLRQEAAERRRRP